MRSPKNSLHNLQHDEGGNYMAETETGQTGHHMKYSVILLCSAHLLMDGTVSVMTQSFHATKNTELIGFAGD